MRMSSCLERTWEGNRTISLRNQELWQLLFLWEYLASCWEWGVRRKKKRRGGPVGSREKHGGGALGGCKTKLRVKTTRNGNICVSHMLFWLTSEPLCRPQIYSKGALLQACTVYFDFSVCTNLNVRQNECSCTNSLWFNNPKEPKIIYWKTKFFFLLYCENPSSLFIVFLLHTWLIPHNCSSITVPT